MTTSSGQGKHLPRLDSVRGLAALSVVGYHALAPGKEEWERELSGFLGFFFDGRIAVVVFFVLSGLVLGHSLRRAGPPSVEGYLQFCVRRIFRIFPAYFIATFFYLVLYKLVPSHPGTGFGVLNYYREAPFSAKVLLENFFFLHQGLNGVTWTLKVELAAALFLPFMHYFAMKADVVGRGLLLVLLIGLSFLPDSQSTRICLYMFYSGYLLSPLIQHPAVEQPSAKNFQLWILFGLGLCGFALGHSFLPTYEGGRRWAMAGGAIGAVTILFLIIRAPDLAPFRLLDLPVIRYLGKISYSFYLYNLLCLDVVRRYIAWPNGMNDVFLSGMIMLTACILCAGLASLSFFLVERPFIRWGSMLFDAVRAKIFHNGFGQLPSRR